MKTIGKSFGPPTTRVIGSTFGILLLLCLGVEAAASSVLMSKAVIAAYAIPPALLIFVIAARLRFYRVKVDGLEMRWLFGRSFIPWAEIREITTKRAFLGLGANRGYRIVGANASIQIPRHVARLDALLHEIRASTLIGVQERPVTDELVAVGLRPWVYATWALAALFIAFGASQVSLDRTWMFLLLSIVGAAQIARAPLRVEFDPSEVRVRYVWRKETFSVAEIEKFGLLERARGRVIEFVARGKRVRIEEFAFQMDAIDLANRLSKPYCNASGLAGSS